MSETSTATTAIVAIATATATSGAALEAQSEETKLHDEAPEQDDETQARQPKKQKVEGDKLRVICV